MRRLWIVILLLGCTPPPPVPVLVERDASKEWEPVASGTDRLKVEGGWIYRDVQTFQTYGPRDAKAVAMTYVPAAITATAWQER